MRGYSNAKILTLCNKNKSRGFKAPPYWTAEIYGFGKWIRKYCSYPRFLPLCISTDHGAPTRSQPIKSELESSAPVQFYHSSLLVNEWKSLSKKDAHVLYSPFVFCKNINKYKKSPDAKGTLAFPAHTTMHMENESDVEEYIKQLLKLPPKFKPISVCLYYYDILKEKHKIYQKYKIPIYTAGYYLDERFTERFYQVLRNFKYATSNIGGSYLYYSVEMGIPFSIYGQEPLYLNRGDSNFALGKYISYDQDVFYREMHKLFGGLHTKITFDQKEFVENNLGLKDGVKPDKMRKILYKCLAKWFFSMRLFEWFGKIIKVVVSSSYLLLIKL